MEERFQGIGVVDGVRITPSVLGGLSRSQPTGWRISTRLPKGSRT
jgi:hypothetical protein